MPKLGELWFNSIEKVFIPYLDVFMTGGRNALKQFADKKEKQHLIVIPEVFLDDLANKSKRGEWSEAESAKDTLEFLDSCYMLDPEQGILQLGNNLYLKLDEESNFEKMVDKSKNNYADKMIIITNAPEVKIKFKKKYFNVENSTFDKLDSYLVNDTLLEIDEPGILNNFYLKNLVDLPIKNAEKILGRNLLIPGGGPILREKSKKYLYFNQVIRFDREKELYGIITGKPISSKTSDRIVGLDDVVLHLIDEKEKHELMNQNMFGIKPKNVEQAIALKYVLNNENIRMAMIIGGQGSGKTVLSYGAALNMVLIQEGYKKAEKIYETLRLIKADDKVGGRDMGFLPGTAYEKNFNIFKSFEIAHKFSYLKIPFQKMLEDPSGETLDFPKRLDNKTGIEKVYLPPRNPAITFDYSLFARGVTWSDEVIYFDEFQNFTQREARDLVGRLGVGSKGIISGDIEQIDNPKNSINDNGLLGALNEYLGRPYFGVIKLEENFRSIMSDHSRYWKVYK